jgi:hypothetical protein
MAADVEPTSSLRVRPLAANGTGSVNPTVTMIKAVRPSQEPSSPRFHDPENDSVMERLGEVLEGVNSIACIVLTLEHLMLCLQ